MLDAQAQLRQYGIGQVARGLGNEVHPHTLRTDKSHHLLQTILQGLGGPVEQQVRFVEEQRKHRLVGVAALRQLLEQLGQQPQEEGRINLWRLVHQAAGVKQVDAPAAIAIDPQQILQLQRRLTEQRLGPLLFQRGQAPLQGLGRSGGHQRAVLAQQLWVVLQMAKQRLEVFQVEQQQPLAVGNLERRIERRLLAVGQFKQVAQQQRTHFAEGSAQRMTTLPGDVPQAHRVGLGLVGEPRHPGNAFGHLALGRTRRPQATQVSFHVCREHCHTRVAEHLGQTLQGHGLAGAGRSGDQSMAVGQAHGLADWQAV